MQRPTDTGGAFQSTVFAYCLRFGFLYFTLAKHSRKKREFVLYASATGVQLAAGRFQRRLVWAAGSGLERISAIGRAEKNPQRIE